MKEKGPHKGLFLFYNTVVAGLTKNIPDSPGVYLFKGARGKRLYIGKAGNLKRRVSSYYQKAHDSKTERLVQEVKSIGYEKTDTAIEALILEAELIKKFVVSVESTVPGENFTARVAREDNTPLPGFPFEIDGSVIYYVGPTPTPRGEVIGSAGPTSSYRMDTLTPNLLKA